MAAPTPTTYQRQVGKHVAIAWDAEWANTDNMTDVVVLDLSAMAENYTNTLTVKKLFLLATTGIEVVLEFDASTDSLVAVLPEGATGPVNIDFSDWPDGGITKTGAGATGDLVITPPGAGSGDRIYLAVTAELS